MENKALFFQRESRGSRPVLFHPILVYFFVRASARAISSYLPSLLRKLVVFQSVPSPIVLFLAEGELIFVLWIHPRSVFPLTCPRWHKSYPCLTLSMYWKYPFLGHSAHY